MLLLEFHFGYLLELKDVNYLNEGFTIIKILIFNF